MSKLRAAPKALASADKDVAGFPFLASLAEREEMVRNGKLTTIIFIRDVNQKGQEVSGYIDYAHRLKLESCVEQQRAPKQTGPGLVKRQEGQELSGYINYAHRLKLESCVRRDCANTKPG